MTADELATGFNDLDLTLANANHEYSFFLDRAKFWHSFETRSQVLLNWTKLLKGECYYYMRQMKKNQAKKDMLLLEKQSSSISQYITYYKAVLAYPKLGNVKLRLIDTLPDSAPEAYLSRSFWRESTLN
jgi:hypothetical protein